MSISNFPSWTPSGVIRIRRSYRGIQNGCQALFFGATSASRPVRPAGKRRGPISPKNTGEQETLWARASRSWLGPISNPVRSDPDDFMAGLTGLRWGRKQVALGGSQFLAVQQRPAQKCLEGFFQHRLTTAGAASPATPFPQDGIGERYGEGTGHRPISF
jgi:hypothetical protein